jgi:hypothetical protein
LFCASTLRLTHSDRGPAWGQRRGVSGVAAPASGSCCARLFSVSLIAIGVLPWLLPVRRGGGGRAPQGRKARVRAP